MALHVGAPAGLRMLALILNAAPQEDLALKLFVNDWIPAEHPDDTEANYTELTGHGYAPIPLEADDLGFLAGPPGVATYPQQVFALTPGPAATVYGYYLVWAPSGQLAWAERLSTPQPIATLDVDVKVAPRFTLAPAA